MSDAHTVALLLRELDRGQKQALDRLIPLVYAELRRMTHAQLRTERADHSLQPTALVHELYFRIAGREQTQL
jgi:ECF sigma factor